MEQMGEVSILIMSNSVANLDSGLAEVDISLLLTEATVLTQRGK
jgi:hypothetical protein